MEQGRVTVLVHCTFSHCQIHEYQVWSFESMVTKLCSGQEMLYTINQREIIQKRKKVELRFLNTVL